MAGAGAGAGAGTQTDFHLAMAVHFCCRRKTIFPATGVARVEKSAWKGESPGGERRGGAESRNEADLQLSNGGADKVVEDGGEGGQGRGSLRRGGKPDDFPFFAIVWR